jgi:hypothetical protein
MDTKKWQDVHGRGKMCCYTSFCSNESMYWGDDRHLRRPDIHDAVEASQVGWDDDYVSDGDYISAAKCALVDFLCWKCALEHIEHDQTLEAFEEFVELTYSKEIKAAIAIQAWYRDAVARRRFLRQC